FHVTGVQTCALPILQIAYIRENQQKVITALAKRNIDAAQMIEDVVRVDEDRRATQASLDNALAESNALSRDIGQLMKNGEKSKAAILREKTLALKETTRQLGEQLERLAL